MSSLLDSIDDPDRAKPVVKVPSTSGDLGMIEEFAHVYPNRVPGPALNACGSVSLLAVVFATSNELNNRFLSIQ